MIDLSHQRNEAIKMKRMKKLKEVEIDVLCKFGRFGVGKSAVLGFFDFDIPNKCIKDTTKTSKEK